MGGFVSSYTDGEKEFSSPFLLVWGEVLYLCKVLSNIK